MALVKQIELELKEVFVRHCFYIGLFDSNGDAYNFSPGINFPVATSEYSDGIKTMTAELSLNDDLAGSVTVAPAQNYGGIAFCANIPGWRETDRGLWLDTMLYFLFMLSTDQPAPWSIILTFSKAIDIGNVALFQDDTTGINDRSHLVDLNVKIIGENQAVLASMLYTVEQQNLDYPKEVIARLTPEIPFSAPFVPLNLKPTLPALPKTIKVINKDGRIYIKPKQA